MKYRHFYVREILFAIINFIAKFLEKIIYKIFYPFEKFCEKCGKQYNLFATLNFAFYYLQHNFEKIQIHIRRKISRNFTNDIHHTMQGNDSEGGIGDGENSGCTLM